MGWRTDRWAGTFVRDIYDAYPYRSSRRNIYQVQVLLGFYDPRVGETVYTSDRFDPYFDMI